MLREAVVTSLYAAIQPLHAALDYHLDRQNLLVTNLAHADTPGYVPRDLRRPTSFAAAMELALSRPSSGTALTADGRVASEDVYLDRTAGAGEDGNFVSLDREAAKLAQNQSRYDVVSTMVGAQLRLLSWAANDGTGT